MQRESRLLGVGAITASCHLRFRGTLHHQRDMLHIHQLKLYLNKMIVTHGTQHNTQAKKIDKKRSATPVTPHAIINITAFHTAAHHYKEKC